jgi:raffinose/stachyose/melibiose transport system permease protein
MNAIVKMTRRKYSLLITEVLMIVLAVIWFIPVYYLIVTTLKTPQEAAQSPLGLPSKWVFSNYVTAWQDMQFPRAFFNTFFITAVSVGLILILGGLAGYALARGQTKWKTSIFLFFLAGLVVPFQMNIISLYRLVRNLGLMNTPFAVILVNVSINMPQALFLFKEFIQHTIPKELEEAADIDGYSIPAKFFRIVFPLLKPVAATIAIIATLNVWNEFMTPILFLQSRKNGVILQEISRNIGQFATDWTSLFPMLMLGVAPLLIFYIIMQRHIISGVAAGAIKG